MKHILTTLSSVALLCLAAQTVGAQPGATPPGRTSPAPYGPPPSGPPSGGGPGYGGGGYGPPAPPPMVRSGWHIGFSGGLGVMASSRDELRCDGCEVEPPTGAFDLRVGTMLSPNFAVQGEVWIANRALDAYGDSSLTQAMVLIAGQYWLNPRFWIRGGIGVSSLSVSYFDGYEDVSEQVASGTGLMAAVGYEVIHSRSFALDVFGKMGAGNYQEESESISAATVGLGLTWY